MNSIDRRGNPIVIEDNNANKVMQTYREFQEFGFVEPNAGYANRINARVDYRDDTEDTSGFLDLVLKAIVWGTLVSYLLRDDEK